MYRLKFASSGDENILLHFTRTRSSRFAISITVFKSRGTQFEREGYIIMGIRFEANSSASPGARCIVATSLAASRLCNYHYPQADTHHYAYHILRQ